MLTVVVSGASSTAGAEDAPKPEAPSEADEPKEAPEPPAETPRESAPKGPKDDAGGEDDPSKDDAPPDDEVARDEGDAHQPDDESDPSADEEDEAEENPPVARDDEPLVLLETDRVLRVKARRAMLRASAYERLRAIAEKYHAATNRKLVVTGGGRKAARQAELMHDMLRDGVELLHLYVQAALVRPLIKAYDDGKTKRWGRRRTVAVMTKIIDDQVKEGKYVSRHLAYTAADVRSRGLKKEHVEALQKAVSEVKGARLVDERNGNAPHFHLSL